MKIEGKVESKTEKFNGGIKVNNVWYNATDKTKEYLKSIERGDFVTLETDDKNKIIFVEKSTEVVEEIVENNNEYEIQNIVDFYGRLMKECKDKTDELFGKDDRYKDFVGQHCNSIFIACDRLLREKKIRILI